jgi:hypothetical protein
LQAELPKIICPGSIATKLLVPATNGLRFRGKPERKIRQSRRTRLIECGSESSDNELEKHRCYQPRPQLKFLEDSGTSNEPDHLSFGDPLAFI